MVSTMRPGVANHPSSLPASYRMTALGGLGLLEKLIRSGVCHSFLSSWVVIHSRFRWEVARRPRTVSTLRPGVADHPSPSPASYRMTALGGLGLLDIDSLGGLSFVLGIVWGGGPEATDGYRCRSAQAAPQLLLVAASDHWMAREVV